MIKRFDTTKGRRGIIFENYTFRPTENKLVFRCTKKTCSSRLSLKENLEVISHTPHNHNTDQKALNKIQIHEKIKYMAVKTPKSKNEIVCVFYKNMIFQNNQRF
jgi:hypothetical protein